MGKMAPKTNAAKKHTLTEKNLKKFTAQTARMLRDSDTKLSGSEEVYLIKNYPWLREKLPRGAKKTSEEVTPSRWHQE